MIRYRTSGLVGLLWAVTIGALPAAPQADPAAIDQNFFLPDSRIRAAVVDVLENHPRLDESLARYRAALQKVPQVSSLPDPMLTFTEFLRQPETRVGPQTSSLMISQRLPWFGKLDLDGGIAALEAAELYEEHRVLERRLVAETKEAVYELAYVDTAIDITREEEDRLSRYEELASARYAAGSGLQQAVIRIQAEITRLAVRLEALGHDRRVIEARLNTLRGRPPEDPIDTFDLQELVVAFAALPALESMYAAGEAHRPELRARLNEIERNQLRLDRARKDYWPDFTLSAGLVNVDGRRDPAGIAAPPPGNGKNVVSVAVGINIPLGRDRYRAAELAAVEGMEAGRSAYRAAVDTMEYDIRGYASRIEALGRQLDLYEQVLTPQAEAALAATEAAYETGGVESLDLLDAEGVLVEIRLGEARIEADYLRALAGLERALGTRFPEVLEEATGESEEQP